MGRALYQTKSGCRLHGLLLLRSVLALYLLKIILSKELYLTLSVQVSCRFLILGLNLNVENIWVQLIIHIHIIIVTVFLFRLKVQDYSWNCVMQTMSDECSQWCYPVLKWSECRFCARSLPATIQKSPCMSYSARVIIA